MGIEIVMKGSLSVYIYITSHATFRCPLKDDSEDKRKNIFNGTQIFMFVNTNTGWSSLIMFLPSWYNTSKVSCGLCHMLHDVHNLYEHAEPNILELDHWY